jgi:hypothetical protein|tara:strand:+ start:318 stop:527 length:210 start_codon:yes stop_codon:yes gene_type:complete
MADYKPKEGTFTMWKNKFKKDGDKKPDYTGNGMVNGEKKDFSLWINQDDKGDRYLSGQFKEEYKKKTPF